MLNSVIIAAALLLLGGLLYFEKKENRTGVLLTKTPLSALFIVAALVQPHVSATYFYPLLTGLIFCMAGDIFLALPQKKMFLWGLVSFLLGHVGYIVAFFSVSQVNLWTGIGVIITLAAGVRVFIWLRPHLGSMKLPVLMYVIVISLMLCGALSILAEVEILPDHDNRGLDFLGNGFHELASSGLG